MSEDRKGEVWEVVYFSLEPDVYLIVGARTDAHLSLNLMTGELERLHPGNFDVHNDMWPKWTRIA